VFNVLGSAEYGTGMVPQSLPDDTPDLIADLHESLRNVSRKNFREFYHDAVHARDDIVNLFNHGYITLQQRSLGETIFWALCRRVQALVGELDYVPEELLGLERALADTYFCNFSMFQSVPDSWAVQQLFPVLPIHRLDEAPTRRAILADITCDSDGKIDRFIDLKDVKGALELHPINGNEYILGVFLTGAYQEILGDLHNLFGDTNTVLVGTNDDGSYRIKHVMKGDTIHDVLTYVQYNPGELLHRFRQSLEEALRARRITFEESAEFLQAYERGLDGYTYLDTSNQPRPFDSTSGSVPIVAETKPTPLPADTASSANPHRQPATPQA
jgi:arginine decarboxylase